MRAAPMILSAAADMNAYDFEIQIVDFDEPLVITVDPDDV